MNAPAPGSPEWQRLMTASKVAAVLGLSPWQSPRSLWHQMRGELPRDEGNNATRRGQYLESGVLAWFADRHDADLEWAKWEEQAYRVHPENPWAAATLDALGEDEHGNVAAVEIKTAASSDDWGQPGTDEIPAYYAAQVMWQMWVAGADIAYVAVLFGRPRLDFAEYVVQRDDALIAAIVDKCRTFYDSLTSDVPPPLDDTVATYDAVRRLHPDIDRDTSVELTEDEARAFTLSKSQLDLWDAQHRAAKSVVLDRMGRAQKATHAGQVVARRQPNKYGVSLVAVAKTIDTESEAVA